MDKIIAGKGRMIRQTVSALIILILGLALIIVAVGYTFEEVQMRRRIAKEKSSPYVIYIPDERKYSDGHYARCLERIDAKYKYDDRGNLLVQSAALERVANSCN